MLNKGPRDYGVVVNNYVPSAVRKISEIVDRFDIKKDVLPSPSDPARKQNEF